MTPCSFVDTYWRFGGIYCNRHQERITFLKWRNSSEKTASSITLAHTNVHKSLVMEIYYGNYKEPGINPSARQLNPIEINRYLFHGWLLQHQAFLILTLDADFRQTLNPLYVWRNSSWYPVDRTLGRSCGPSRRLREKSLPLLRPQFRFPSWLHSSLGSTVTEISRLHLIPSTSNSILHAHISLSVIQVAYSSFPSFFNFISCFFSFLNLPSYIRYGQKDEQWSSHAVSATTIERAWKIASADCNIRYLHEHRDKQEMYVHRCIEVRSVLCILDSSVVATPLDYPAVNHSCKYIMQRHNHHLACYYMFFEEVIVYIPKLVLPTSHSAVIPNFVMSRKAISINSYIFTLPFSLMGPGVA
jgi:hypothetical protein